MVKNAVEIKDVCVKFNKHPILHDIDLIIKNNDFLAIIGPNAGGKSTLLKVILGLVKVDQGTVKVFGESPGKPSNPIGYLPQHVSFDPDFPINVFDTVLFGRYHGFFQKYSDLDHEKVKEALAEVGMLDMKDRQMGQLSGGQMQQVFIAVLLWRNQNYYY